MDNRPLTDRRRIPYKWLALAVVSIANLLTPLDGAIVNIALPALTEAFETEVTVSLWVMLAYMLVSTGLMLTLGRLGDTWGRKRIYSIGLAVFALGVALCFVSQSIGQLIGAHVLQSVGMAMVSATGPAIVIAAFPGNERGKALGILQAAVGVGLTTGPALGGLLLDNWGWRYIFGVQVPIALAGVIAAWLILLGDEAPSQGVPPVDLTGAITLFLGLCSFLFAINQGYSRGWASLVVLASAAVALVMMPLFLWNEGRVESPVLNLGLFRIRNFAGPSTALVLRHLSFRGPTMLLPFFLIQARRLPATLAGLIMTTSPLIMIGLAPLSGWLSDRMGTRLLTAVGLGVGALGTFVLATLGAESGILEVLLPILIMGVGGAIYETPNSSALMGSVPGHQLGTASAMIATCRTVGQATGLAMAGTIYATRRAYHYVEAERQGLSGHSLMAAAIAGGFRDTILICAVLATLIVPTFLFMTRGTSKKTATTPKPRA